MIKASFIAFLLIIASFTLVSVTHAAPAAAVKKVSARQQLIIDVLPVFIKVYGNNPSNSEKAWWRKRITCGEINTQNELLNSMAFHKSKKVRKGRENICPVKTANTSAASASKANAVIKKSIGGVKNNDTVRIGITFVAIGKPMTITSNGKFQIREGADKVLATMNADQNIAVTWSGNMYHIRGSGKKFDVSNKVRFVPLHGAIMKIVNYSDPSVTYPGKNYNRFRGIIEIRKCDGCNEMWAINELRVEDYLKGLGETSGEGPEEYVKALGIAARTYVLYHKIITGGRSESKDFDITNTPNDQIYRGYEMEIIRGRMVSIFAKTKGIIVADKDADKPVSAIYFSDSDGRTRSAKEAWNTSRFPHLQKSVADPYHQSKACRGHCVGMSAQGAYGFAKAKNWTFQQILSYYYQGIKLVKAY
ncbi:MAG: hypothetical protein A3C02_04645 [Candidatus Andersenbacteria bacterium RIFCSPHIGHO2_02_FULL_45_11]|uniref:Sporulation stage II protein D amidase enhancer LytB N-terminal domain-containing protein n=1 Tax=Candidatus Andersenbacteria bacterium RIFCSPHIGHO2_12_FULL_45_11 TaxID=1797281 RepID=A0A1G1X2L0_9BACT|nr:MAG: hypothetical protein A2805_00205 [Candidatus Andersenbacteria bacterium RIFCSPHIGHO2_01_FULL_46_36]OGY32257.1 MAG: hypothetical protein A3C02_04645 [Candidatus Andersenbacteria bacterium RIFCSPHIGHO2_02_FULL_45_11]OGY34184.1 MAG: hypothetical protein A3D99_00500 [Candidatus Andersenbacteria bacterium RIFCSPHIGHO2_12_FULL_45_11]